MAHKIRVVFVCLGNICRSPLAEGSFRHLVQARGLDDRFDIDSAGTSSYHAGEPPDPGSVDVARRNGIDISRQRSRQLVREELTSFDYIIAMDSQNHRNILRLAANPDALRGKLWLMRNFERSPEGLGDDLGVPDPWGGGRRGFEEVHGIVHDACGHLLAFILAKDKVP